MLQTAHFKRCIQTLDASFALLKRATPGSVEYEVYRNATILMSMIGRSCQKPFRKKIKDNYMVFK